MAPPATARPPVGAEPPQDALTYVRAVKSRFQATKPEVYEAFLEVMRDFKNARCVANDDPKGALHSGVSHPMIARSNTPR